MRATPRQQIGAIGESAVVLAFERIGWGPMRNSEHDLGTDLFVSVRDERGEQLGLLVGVQVKAGVSAFREPERDADGDIVGWWFRDDDRSHIDDWLRHTVPHLIVLYDDDTRSSYWAHVSPEAVRPTGQGAKILVPATHTIDLGIGRLYWGSPRGLGVNSGPEGPRSAQICGTLVGWARSRELRGS